MENLVLLMALWIGVFVGINVLAGLLLLLVWHPVIGGGVLIGLFLIWDAIENQTE